MLLHSCLSLGGLLATSGLNDDCGDGSSSSSSSPKLPVRCQRIRRCCESTMSAEHTSRMPTSANSYCSSGAAFACGITLWRLTSCGYSFWRLIFRAGDRLRSKRL